jgi:hypothetical protein
LEHEVEPATGGDDLEIASSRAVAAALENNDTAVSVTQITKRVE